ncbi:MAG: isoleucine--tRNA ligase [Bacilli bacterium]|nr:isoleucine--tRNA ligase [Bacilli bacterium]
MEVKKSLTMPTTSFEMRGNLNVKEPKVLEKWKKMDLYHKMLLKNKDQKPFVLHDGPPYANGDIHVGHAMNKILKDFIIRYKNMSGFYAPYIPGWDTHGLPIEVVLQKKGINRKEMDLATYRDLCRDYALSQVNRQKEQFIRLGSLGDYENPYITLKKDYEAHQISVFAKMALDGLIYKGVKPVYWSPSSESALAEAEIEYKDVTSTSIYVRFKVKDGKNILNGDEYFVIWTTTPWTMPANLAICLNKDFDYGVFETDKGVLIFLKEFENKLKEVFELKECKLRKVFKGSELEYITCKHPMYDRESVVILGDHVTNESGTGCVHTAPGHGEDDFNVGKLYHLDVLCPVDSKGYMMEEAGEDLKGLFYEKANDVVLQKLTDCGALLKSDKITHSYPHDWRTKKPIIFRVTAQWFASIEPIRKQLLDNISNIKWYPSWGEVRLGNMIKDRGDWCISRQRAWGVPIPIIYAEDDTPIVEKEVFDHIIKLVNDEGSNVWFKRDVKELLPENYQNAHSPNGIFRKETDIMDVWFDSGSSSIGALYNQNLPYPVDLYLEGSDQYRGWFNSSLIIGSAYKGVAPYKTCVSHGFVLDGKGNKMSKSLGNTVDPNKVCNQYGADILRLWVASVDYQQDVRISDELLKQVIEQYRKIRNTLRFLLGNLSNGCYGFFNKDKDYQENLEIVDNYIENKLNSVINNCLDAYDQYDFQTVISEITNFMANDLSSFYLDITKDILYCDYKDSTRRLQVQTVIYDVLNSLIRLLNPLLPFTIEEVYDACNFKVEESAQLLDMVTRKEVNDGLLFEYNVLRATRNDVLKALEEARSAKIIGSSQEATLHLVFKDNFKTNQEIFNKLSYIEQIRFFIVSKIVFEDNGNKEYDTVKVLVTKNDDKKCERCWNHFETVGEDGLCPRCREALHKYEELSNE